MKSHSKNRQPLKVREKNRKVEGEGGNQVEMGFSILSVEVIARDFYTHHRAN